MALFGPPRTRSNKITQGDHQIIAYGGTLTPLPRRKRSCCGDVAGTLAIPSNLCIERRVLRKPPGVWMDMYSAALPFQIPLRRGVEGVETIFRSSVSLVTVFMLFGRECFWMTKYGKSSFSYVAVYSLIEVGSASYL